MFEDLRIVIDPLSEIRYVAQGMISPGDRVVILVSPCYVRTAPARLSSENKQLLFTSLVSILGSVGIICRQTAWFCDTGNVQITESKLEVKRVLLYLMFTKT